MESMRGDFKSNTVYCSMDDTCGAGNGTRAPDNIGQWYDGCDRDVILFDDVMRCVSGFKNPA
jgi:hypothetical protein